MDDLRNPLDHMGEIAWRTLQAPSTLFLDQETMERHMSR